jgi:hypothetical protein
MCRLGERRWAGERSWDLPSERDGKGLELRMEYAICTQTLGLLVGTFDRAPLHGCFSDVSTRSQCIGLATTHRYSLQHSRNSIANISDANVGLVADVSGRYSAVNIAMIHGCFNEDIIRSQCVILATTHRYS